MGTSKTEEFSNRDNKIADFANALSHPARIAILRVLIEKNACMCGQIVDELPLSQSTVSQHLKQLKSAGLVKGTISGPNICYCIDPLVWVDARKTLRKFFKTLDIENLPKC